MVEGLSNLIRKAESLFSFRSFSLINLELIVGITREPREPFTLDKSNHISERYTTF